MPTKYAGEGQSLNAQYVYTRESDDGDGASRLDLLCNRPPPTSEDDQMVLFGSAVFGGKCSIEDMWMIVHTLMDMFFVVDVLLSLRLAYPKHDDPIQVLS